MCFTVYTDEENEKTVGELELQEKVAQALAKAEFRNSILEGDGRIVGAKCGSLEQFKDYRV